MRFDEIARACEENKEKKRIYNLFYVLLDRVFFSLLNLIKFFWAVCFFDSFWPIRFSVDSFWDSCKNSVVFSKY